MPTHLVVDLETLDTVTTAAPIEIGVVAFDPEGEIAALEDLVPSTEKFYLRVNLWSSMEAGLTINPSTIAWWLMQSEEARKEAAWSIEQGIALKAALGSLGSWVRATRPIRYWSHGASFDLPILQNAFRAVNHQSPFDYRLMRDTRTLFELADVKYKGPQNDAHNALADAYAEAVAIQKALKVLKGRDK